MAKVYRAHPRARPPSAGCARGHAFSDSVPSERERSSFPPSSNAARLWRAGGLHSSATAPPSLCGIATIPDLWPRFPPSARSVRSPDLSLLAPVGETPPEAQSRRDRGISASLRFRGAWFSPVASGVGVAAAPPMALLLRASATARDTRSSGTLKRTSWPRLAALATRPSATAPRRLWAPGGGCNLGGEWVELIPNT